MSMFLKCEEAARTCDKSQYKETTFWEKVKLKIHLIYCLVCKKHSVRNTKLTNAIAKSNVKTMPRADKELLKKRLDKEISK